MAKTPLPKNPPHPLPASPHLKPLPPGLGNPRQKRSGSKGLWHSVNEHWRMGALFLAVAIPVPAAAFSGMAIPLPTAVERLAAALITGRTDIVSDVDAATVQALQAIQIADVRGQIELEDLILPESAAASGAGAGAGTGLANSGSGAGTSAGPSIVGGGQSGPATESDPPESPSEPPVTNDDADSSAPVADPPAPPAEPTVAPVAPSFDTNAGAAPDPVVTDTQVSTTPPKSPKPPEKPKPPEPPKEDTRTDPPNTNTTPPAKPPKKPKEDKPPKEDKSAPQGSPPEMNGSAAGANAGVESGSTNSTSEQPVETEPSQTAAPKKDRGKKPKR
jgi:hypothetical protein